MHAKVGNGAENIREGLAGEQEVLVVDWENRKESNRNDDPLEMSTVYLHLHLHVHALSPFPFPLCQHVMLCFQ